jgi:hypothetical protein
MLAAPSTKRRQPNLTEKLASALLNLATEDQEGRVSYLFSLAEREVMKLMTPEQICSLFQYDHGIHHAIDGSMHPTNLTPRLIQVHRVKTVADRKLIDKTKRVSRAHAEHQAKRAVGGTLAEVIEKIAPKPKPKMRWPQGRKLQSRPFQKRAT